MAQHWRSAGPLRHHSYYEGRELTYRTNYGCEARILRRKGRLATHGWDEASARAGLAGWRLAEGWYQLLPTGATACWCCSD
jgi:hypothetical protein